MPAAGGTDAPLGNLYIFTVGDESCTDACTRLDDRTNSGDPFFRGAQWPTYICDPNGPLRGHEAPDLYNDDGSLIDVHYWQSPAVQAGWSQYDSRIKERINQKIRRSEPPDLEFSPDGIIGDYPVGDIQALYNKDLVSPGGENDQLVDSNMNELSLGFNPGLGTVDIPQNKFKFR